MLKNKVLEKKNEKKFSVFVCTYNCFYCEWFNFTLFRYIYIYIIIVKTKSYILILYIVLIFIIRYRTLFLINCSFPLDSVPCYCWPLTSFPQSGTHHIFFCFLIFWSRYLRVSQKFPALQEIFLWGISAYIKHSEKIYRYFGWLRKF